MGTQSRLVVDTPAKFVREPWACVWWCALAAAACCAAAVAAAACAAFLLSCNSSRSFIASSTLCSTFSRVSAIV
eukprot:8699786-Pyramimonas_sp.AAC.1